MADTAFLTYGITATGSTTARNTPDRLGINVKNVKDWGAVGDGVTDDHAAIQAATSAVWFSTFNKKGTIYFPPGTYYVSAPIEFGGEPNPQELMIAFRGVGNKSKITGNFDGAIISCYHPPASGVAATPILIENLWINQDGTSDDDGATGTTPGSVCIYANGPSAMMVRNVRCTTAKHGIGIENCQGASVFNCHVACTGVTAYRFGIYTSGNATIASCYVTGFTTAVRTSQIGGATTNCIIKDNDIGYEGGPYGIDPGAGNQFLVEFLVMSNYFENNGTGIYAWGGGFGLIAGNSVIGGGGASYGIRSPTEQSHVVFMGNTVSGAFSVAAITTEGQSGTSGQFFLGTSATNSGAGVAWGEEQNNNLWSNTYINSNSTGPAIRQVYSGLPTGGNANRYLGATYWITDGNNNVWGGNVTAGFGGQHVKVRWNGTNWTVVGK